MTDASTVEVRREPAYYVITVDGAEAGKAYFTLHGGDVTFTHTEIDEAYGGRGLGSTLARAALDDVLARGEHAIPQCPFIAGYIRKHPEYVEVVSESARDLVAE